MTTKTDFQTALTLEDQARRLWHRLADIRSEYDTCDFTQDLDSLESFYVLSHIMKTAWRRYDRRTQTRRQLWEKLQTQDIASAVEREAFPNSGDSARPSVSASELAPPSPEGYAGQGGNHCPNWNPNDSLFCDCDDCTSPKPLVFSSVMLSPGFSDQLPMMAKLQALTVWS